MDPLGRLPYSSGNETRVPKSRAGRRIAAVSLSFLILADILASAVYQVRAMRIRAELGTVIHEGAPVADVEQFLARKSYSYGPFPDDQHMRVFIPDGVVIVFPRALIGDITVGDDHRVQYLRLRDFITGP